MISSSAALCRHTGEQNYFTIFKQYSGIFRWHPDEVNNKTYKKCLKDKMKERTLYN